MKFFFRDINPDIAAAWGRWFEGCKDVEISTGDIFAEDAPKADAIVSPANSFGFMDGGIDLAYSIRFGWGLQERLQDKLFKEHDGELPVGQAVIVPTGHADIPWCISAPTMRVPTFVGGTPNAYLAFRAVIREVKRWNGRAFEGYQDTENPDGRNIESILCPGLGTAVGRMSPEDCARQMHHAYLTCWKGEKKRMQSMGEAYANHSYLTGRLV